MSRRHKGRYQQNQGVPAGNDEPAGQDEPMVTGFVRPGMADVIAKRMEEFVTDTGITPEDPENIDEKFVAPAVPVEEDGGTDANPPDASTKAPVADKPAEPPKPDAAVPPPTDADEIELVVDGEKVKKTRAELLEIGRRAAQKELASDKRLEEATRIKREAEELRLQAQSVAPRTPAVEPDVPPVVPPAMDDLDKNLAEKRKAMIQANAYGDTEEQEAAHLEYEQAVFAKANAGRTIPIDVEAIATQVRNRITKEEEDKITSGIISKFGEPEEKGGFADIGSSPHWREMARVEVDRLIAEEGLDGSNWETYRIAGETVRSWMKPKSDGNSSKPPASGSAPVVHKAPTVDPTLSERAARKRQIPSVPTASASATTPNDEKPEDTSQVISELARQRPGQHL
jgi:hypothetical protein